MKNTQNEDSGKNESNSETLIQENISSPVKSKWVIMFDKVPEQKDDEFINNSIHSCTQEGDEGCITARRIKGNSPMVELWEFEGTPANIRTHRDKILIGVSSTNTHSGFNFEIDFKEQMPDGLDLDAYKFTPYSYHGKDTKPLLIAVLDTGVDTSVIPQEFLWQDDDESRPYDKRSGRSFIKNGGEIEDDDPNRHGTLVSSLILEQFRDFPEYPVQIMNLKTHDGSGKGDLFAIIDAICFARDRGADIINASWGFYQDEEIQNSYLKNLITESLLDEGILFITVSGNKTEETGYYFYPAAFGLDISEEQKNLLVVTSINDTMDRISDSHNYSKEWVDFGVPADFTQELGKKEHYMYRLPFVPVDPESTQTLSVSGTSFATAILTGRIGASGKERKGNKKKLLDQIGNGLFGTSSVLDDDINGGRFLKRNSGPLTTMSSM